MLQGRPAHPRLASLYLGVNPVCSAAQRMDQLHHLIAETLRHGTILFGLNRGLAELLPFDGVFFGLEFDDLGASIPPQDAEAR